MEITKNEEEIWGEEEIDNTETENNLLGRSEKD
jgi:hypothetical protein